MVKRTRILTNYYEEYSKEMELVCPSCGWIGHAKDAESEEYKDLFDVSCPKCSKMLLVVPYPTFQQTREAAAAGNLEAIADLPSVQACEARWEQFESIKLKSPDQLPDLEEELLHFTWDGEPGYTVAIKLGERVLWREPGWFECWPRFNEIKDILKAKYGHRFCSLTPTEVAEIWLFGDSLTASDKVSYTAEDPQESE
jgi:DNA-directed RNA polymerase subunit RPC12/RpoP